MSLARVVDRATVGVSVTAEATVAASTGAAPLTEPLDGHVLTGVDHTMRRLSWDQRVLTLLAQRFLFLQQNIVMFGHSITFYNSNS